MRDPSLHTLDARLDAVLLELIERFHHDGPAVFERHRLVEVGPGGPPENRCSDNDPFRDGREIPPDGDEREQERPAGCGVNAR